MKLNKGAMFGLDARIALAIFGALSVISGAALYSAVQNAKAERYRQYFENLVKASEEYYLNTGQPVTNRSVGHLDLSDFVNNNHTLSNWNGPYIPGTVISIAYLRNTEGESLNGGIHVITGGFLQKLSTWTVNSGTQYCVVDSVDCAETFFLTPALSDASTRANIKNLFDLLDKLVDNNDGALSGKIRYIDNGSSSVNFVVYMGFPRKRLS